MKTTMMVAGLLAAAPRIAMAQEPERATFIARRGADTLVVEQATWRDSSADAVMRAKGTAGRVEQHASLGQEGAVKALVIEVKGNPPGDSLKQRVAITFMGDSARMLAWMGSAASTERRIPTVAGTMPFLNMSGLSVDLVLRRAFAIGRDTVSVPLALIGSPVSLSATVVRHGPDSAVIILAGVEFRAHTDKTGRLLGAEVPAQKLVFERMPGHLMVAPTAAPPPAPVSYAAPPGAPYTATDVVVETPGKVHLAGTLTMPHHAPGVKVPAVVTITGSGTEERDERLPGVEGYHPFRDIADTLSRRGIAVLRLDDRGAGGSSPLTGSETSADFANDIRAALAWLRANAEVDGARLGLVGHSEGAVIAPMVAATDPRLRAIALIAGTAYTGRKVLRWQFRRQYSRLADSSGTPAQRAARLAEAETAADHMLDTSAWGRFFADYDPLATARKVRTPTLILQGETDRQVTPEQAPMIAKAMRAGGNRHVTLRTFPRMNHLMLEDASGEGSGYSTLPSKAVRRDLLGTLADWLARELGAP